MRHQFKSCKHGTKRERRELANVTKQADFPPSGFLLVRLDRLGEAGYSTARWDAISRRSTPRTSSRTGPMPQALSEFGRSDIGSRTNSS